MDETIKKNKHAVEVPVRVVPADANRPILPPVDIQIPKPAPAKPKTTVAAAVTKAKTFRPVKHFSPRQRQRAMWLLVSASMVAIVAGWIILFPSQMRGGERHFFSDIGRIIGNWQPTSVTPSTANKEIQSLSQEVFPQFQPKE